MDLITFLSVETVFAEVYGYPLSYIEFVGTVFALLSVWLVARRSIFNWPAGIIGVSLFMVLFYQINLYSDFIEQIYFLITSIYGWYIWSRLGTPALSPVAVVWAQWRERSIYIGAIILGTIALGYFMDNITVIAPTLFPEPASFPYLDAFTTVMSFAATILMIYRRVESWVLWVLVDIVGIWLYFTKGVMFVGILYVCFLVLATWGLIAWVRASRTGTRIEV